VIVVGLAVDSHLRLSLRERGEPLGPRCGDLAAEPGVKATPGPGDRVRANGRSATHALGARRRPDDTIVIGHVDTTLHHIRSMPAQHVPAFRGGVLSEHDFLPLAAEDLLRHEALPRLVGW